MIANRKIASVTPVQLVLGRESKLPGPGVDPIRLGTSSFGFSRLDVGQDDSDCQPTSG